MNKNKSDAPKLIPTKASLDKAAKGFERAKTKSDKSKKKPSLVDFVEVK